MSPYALLWSRRLSVQRCVAMPVAPALPEMRDDFMEFNSRRSPVIGRRGMVACTQPLASEAGMRILQSGGSAADAAVAMAAALNVTEPASTGIGGDAFALHFDAATKNVKAYLGCGRSPAKLTLEHCRARGILGPELPAESPFTVTVPGAPALWENIQEAHGKLDLGQVLKPAIELAEEGFPLHPVSAFQWARNLHQILEQGSPGAHAFLTSEGKAPKAGQVHRNPDLGATFRSLAEHGAKKGFYTGRIANAIIAELQRKGSPMDFPDLADHRTSLEDPISTTYRRHTVYEVPPPTAGIAALAAMNMLESEDLGHVEWDSAKRVHASAEAMRIAYADALAYTADPKVVHVPVEQLLDKEYARLRKETFYNPQKAAIVRPGDPSREHPDCGVRRPAGDTVYFCAVDNQGNACSFINSNYEGFGSGIVPEGCGFSLQNRGANFILQEGHPNCIGPSKRPYHTIIPGLITDADGELYAAFGVMGDFMQPQGHLQVITNMIDYGIEPQAALDAPRWRVLGIDPALGPQSVNPSSIALEKGFSDKTAADLRRYGHAVVGGLSGPKHAIFGRGQIIRRDPESGVLWGGSDPRGDGQVLAW